MKYWGAIVFSAILAMAGCGGSRPATSHGLTINKLLQIKFPAQPVWSPNGRQIAFMWDDGGVHSLNVVSTTGQSQPVKLMTYPWSQVSSEDTVPPAFWSHDGTSLYYPHDGQLWQVAASGGTPHPAWKSAGGESGFVLSPDGTRVAFARETGKQFGEGSDLVVRSLARGTEIRVAHDPHSIRDILWSPDGTHLAYTGGSQRIFHNQEPPAIGHKLIFVASEITPGNLYVVRASGGHPVTVGLMGERGASWVDGTHLVFVLEPSPYKIRMIYLTTATGGAPRLIHKDVEPKFWSMPYGVKGGPQPSPNGRWIAYLTDTDGWDHLYVMPADGGKPVRITDGNFTTWRPAWSHDSTRIAFDANSPGKPGDRRLGIATIGNDPSHATITYITEGRGTNIRPEWSPNDAKLVYQHTDPENSADLFTISADGGNPSRLTESMPAGIDHSQFVAPKLVHYPGAHGQSVAAWLFVPKNLDRSKKHAAIIWVHGDGVNQNYDGWHVQQHYAQYYSFHQYLLQEGYVVIAPDYRGSMGYGRAWRTAVYKSIGVDDALDARMAAGYLKKLPYVDSKRIGIWGLSYGGFFTLIAVTKQPTLFRAAVDVAGSVSYNMYYADPYHNSWTVSRMGGSPEQDPTDYANARPLDHMDKLERPLLILAGTGDTNVPFIETATLIDHLLKHGKAPLITFRMYPGEYHYFDRAYVLDDAWHHVDRFFRQHLQPQVAN